MRFPSPTLFHLILPTRAQHTNQPLVEIYSPPPAPPSTNAKDAEGAADERIAEAFRKEFMDAVQQRQQKKKVQQTTMMGQGAAGGKKEEETLKGPKLGGSRNARAAVREALLKGKK